MSNQLGSGWIKLDQIRPNSNLCQWCSFNNCAAIVKCVIFVKGSVFFFFNSPISHFHQWPWTFLSLVKQNTEIGKHFILFFQVYTERTWRYVGAEPPIAMIGCHRNSEDSTFRHFSRSGTAFDELSIWTRKLTVNRTHNEILYFTAGYGKFCVLH